MTSIVSDQRKFFYKAKREEVLKEMGVTQQDLAQVQPAAALLVPK